MFVQWLPKEKKKEQTYFSLALEGITNTTELKLWGWSGWLMPNMEKFCDILVKSAAS